MLWLTLILIGIILLIILIWMTRITIKVEYVNYSGNNKLYIQLRAWFGLIRYTVKIPVIEAETNPPALKAEGEKGSKEKEDTGGRLTAEELLSMLEKGKEIINRIIGVHPILMEFLAQITVRKFDWKTAIGTGDAAVTGMLAGAVWAVKGSIAGLVHHHMKLKVKPSLHVTPYFQYRIAGTMLACMFTFRAGKAISAGIRIFTHWKGKKSELISKSMQVMPNEE
ncbi:hypothetical protein AM500_07735 [Bacillus sp. FJAT-18017]|uniref:DUF2953 domain-containing protein n=1 Tax=Bacillus sp. FJAT-18017 TaxID=1705566 RepID=UPI0006AE48EA|nr:DUF2953 domain-containing protein [Bacillus sp. FJAT-18017]ALC89667.1 hypothetical protein AM500_07735 [Bacillus sp. FJAT-18017]